MARLSGMEFAIADIPYAPGLEEFAAAHGLDAERLALGGGEEYEIVFTARPSDMGRIEELARRARTRVSVLGRVEGPGGKQGKRSRGGGGGGGGAYIVKDGGGGKRRAIRGGWRHFGAGAEKGPTGRGGAAGSDFAGGRRGNEGGRAAAAWAAAGAAAALAAVALAVAAAAAAPGEGTEHGSGAQEGVATGGTAGEEREWERIEGERNPPRSRRGHAQQVVKARLRGRRRMLHPRRGRCCRRRLADLEE